MNETSKPKLVRSREGKIKTQYRLRRPLGLIKNKS